jgi:hypothetical protein
MEERGEVRRKRKSEGGRERTKEEGEGLRKKGQG